MDKQSLRNIYKEKRNQLSAAQQEKMDDLLLIQFQQLLIDIPTYIMTYAPIAKFKEFDPQLITDYCYFKNPDQQLVYPIMNAAENSILPVIVTEETSFITNPLGIDEPVGGIEIYPEEIELILVPLLCADKKGNRVGYGKGYYDRFLKECQKNVIKIGFAYFDPVDRIDDLNEFDVPLNYCITPEMIFVF